MVCLTDRSMASQGDRVIVKLYSENDEGKRGAGWYKGTIIETPRHTTGDKNYKVRMDSLPKGEWDGDSRVYNKKTNKWGKDRSRPNIIVVHSGAMRKIGTKKFYGRDDSRRNRSALNMALASNKSAELDDSRLPFLQGRKHLEGRIAGFLGGRRKTHKKRRKRKSTKKTKKRKRRTKRRKSARKSRRRRKRR